MAIDLDLEQWPFVFSRWDTDQTSEDLDGYLLRMTAVLAREQPFVGIAFVKKWNRRSGAVEKMARWMKETDQATRKHCVAAGMITTSTAFRFTLGAVLLIKPMPYPYGVYANFAEAIRFVRTAAKPRGLMLPEPRRPWLEIP